MLLFTAGLTILCIAVFIWGLGLPYPLLTRLKDAGLLTYRWEESRSGPPRKYYRLTTVGEKFLNELDLTWEELSQAVKKTTRRNAQR